MNEWYQTIMTINFTSGARVKKFADALDNAEIDSRPNDFGPSWLGNVLHVLGEKLDETAHNGYITEVDIVDSLVCVAFESGRGVHSEPLVKLMKNIDPSATYTVNSVQIK